MGNPRLSRRFAAAGVLMLSLAGCSSPVTLPASCRNSSAIAATPTSPPVSPSTPIPVVDGTPALVLEPPEFVSSPTPTRISLPLPQERIVIEDPGPGSQVVSPVRVAGWADRAPGDGSTCA